MGNNNAGYEELLVIMEWCPCMVPDLLKDRGGFLNRIETTKVMYQACAALSALHKMSPAHIHRDIKGENLLISPNGIIKLCDFGSVTTSTFYPDDSWNHMQRTKVEEDREPG
jgi:serine/threonine protein kinase